MKKRYVRRIWHIIRPIKPSYFLLAAGICSLVCVLALRHNSEHMAQLRQAVYVADKKGTDVQKPLQDLQAYVTAHMNTGLGSGSTGVYPPIQLQYTYQRLADQHSAEVAANNSNLYSRAQAYCQAANPSGFSGRGRVPCIEQYVQDHGVKVPAVSASLYQFDFVAPKWSPDLAGWSLLATIVLLLVTVLTWVVDRRIKRLAD